MKKWFSRKLAPIIMVAPTTVWMILFIFIPMIIVLIVSLVRKDTGGGIIYELSGNGYAEMFKIEYLRIILKSLWVALEATVICLALGYPFAFIISKLPKKYINFCVMLIMLPFWINSVIRIYGWDTLLRDEGVLNKLLMSWHIIKHPIVMMKTEGAVLFGLVYELLPFMVLPLYTSISKLDNSMVEASADLGATRPRTFTRVVLPLTMPGIFAGSIQTFIPALGLFYIGDMMGGARYMYIGNLINNQFGSGRNWPLGAALSIFLIVLTLVMMRQYAKVGNLEDMA
ncbi:MAG: ABC transporter permease [Oscillospiraceae bacterium]|nr:ABC transporter permease [Oscillospiraceae bacterium]